MLYILIVTEKDAKVISYEEATGGKGEGEKKDGKVKLQKVMNVMGSNAGAGSGEFHEFRNGRRKEMFRLQALDREYEEKEKEVSSLVYVCVHVRVCMHVSMYV